MMYLEEKVKNTQLQIEVEFLKNPISTRNIGGKLMKIKEENKYKGVPPPFNHNYSLIVDKEKR